MSRNPTLQNEYARLHGEIVASIERVIGPLGFTRTTWTANLGGRGSELLFARSLGWRTDKVRLLFMWGLPGRSEHTEVHVHAPLGDGTEVEVDGGPIAGLARKAARSIRIKEGDAARGIGIPPRELAALRSDLRGALGWIEEHYGTPRLMSRALGSERRNGVVVETEEWGRLRSQLGTLERSGRRGGPTLTQTLSRKR